VKAHPWQRQGGLGSATPPVGFNRKTIIGFMAEPFGIVFIREKAHFY
jgi:hypothetical protein